VSTATLLLVLDLLGIAVFAASGALTGVQKQLDIFGVVFLAGATGLGGGFIRDALIGATPAAALGDWRYLAVPAASIPPSPGSPARWWCSMQQGWGCSPWPGRARLSMQASVRSARAQSGW
jgi:hypothetical protein